MLEHEFSHSAAAGQAKARMIFGFLFLFLSYTLYAWDLFLPKVEAAPL